MQMDQASLKNRLLLNHANPSFLISSVKSKEKNEKKHTHTHILRKEKPDEYDCMTASVP